MDPFESLPPEIRLPILTMLPTRSDIAAAARASPALFQQCHDEYSASIIRRSCVARDFEGDLLQDAMAVILFPTTSLSAAKDHIRRWAARKFWDPFQKPFYRATIATLDKLSGVLRLVIEDYLHKATSASLPLAYRTLPRWTQQGYLKRPSQRRLQEARGATFNLESLAPQERKELYRAFLHHEVLCRYYGPQLTNATASNRVWKCKLFQEMGGDCKGYDYRFYDEQMESVWGYYVDLYRALMTDRLDFPSSVVSSLPARSRMTALRESLSITSRVRQRLGRWFWRDLMRCYWTYRTDKVFASGGLCMALNLLGSERDILCNAISRLYFLEEQGLLQWHERIDRISIGPLRWPGQFFLKFVTRWPTTDDDFEGFPQGAGFYEARVLFDTYNAELLKTPAWKRCQPCGLLQWKLAGCEVGSFCRKEVLIN